MISKPTCWLLFGAAVSTPVYAAVPLECDQVVVSAAQLTVVKTPALIFAATNYPSDEISAGSPKPKQLQKFLYKRLLSYWMKESGYSSITVETSGMATSVVTCDSKQYAVLYVPVDSVRIFEKKTLAQDSPSVTEASESLQFERME